MTYFVSSVEFVCGRLLIIGLLSTLCCVAFITDMIVAITTVQLATITKALSFIGDALHIPATRRCLRYATLLTGPNIGR
jgi:uncharacterized membrane protein YphA (DoxX/SURF4 family)